MLKVDPIRIATPWWATWSPKKYDPKLSETKNTEHGCNWMYLPALDPCKENHKNYFICWSETWLNEQTKTCIDQIADLKYVLSWSLGIWVSFMLVLLVIDQQILPDLV